MFTVNNVYFRVWSLLCILCSYFDYSGLQPFCTLTNKLDSTSTASEYIWPTKITLLWQPSQSNSPHFSLIAREFNPHSPTIYPSGNMVLSMRLDEPGEANTFRCGKDDVLLPAFNVQCAAFLMEVRSDYFYCQQPLTCFTTVMFEWLLSPDQTSWIKRLMKLLQWTNTINCTLLA